MTDLCVVSGSRCQKSNSCFANALVACYAGVPSRWSKDDIDQILETGFVVYQYLIKRRGLRNGSYLNTEALQNQKYTVTLSTSRCEITVNPWTFSGHPSGYDDGDHSCEDLETAIEKLFKSFNKGLLFVNEQWLAILKVDA